MKVFLVANPAAGQGRGGRMIAKAQRALAAYGDVTTLTTERRGDEERVTRDALDAGAETILGLGGDGTWSRIGAVLCETGSACRLAMAAAGTGNDLARNVGAPARAFDATAALIWNGSTRAIDAIAVDDGWCLNVLGAGFDAAVLAAAEGPSLLTGSPLYVTTALREMFGYAGLDVRIDGVDTGTTSRRRLLVTIANGARFGGAFLIAPSAKMDDGILELTAIDDAGPMARMKLFASVVRGRHGGRPGVIQRSGPRFTLRFSEPPVLDVDGEFRRASRATVTAEVRRSAWRAVTYSAGGPGAPARPDGRP